MIIECKRCGAIIPDGRTGQKWCAACRSKVHAEDERVRKYKQRHGISPLPEPKSKAKPRLTVAEVDKLAAEAGISYGKYVALHREELK